MGKDGAGASPFWKLGDEQDDLNDRFPDAKIGEAIDISELPGYGELKEGWNRKAMLLDNKKWRVWSIPPYTEKEFHP